MRTFTLKHFTRSAQFDQHGNTLEYSLALILVAFAIVTGASAWGTGVVFEFLAASRIT